MDVFGRSTNGYNPVKHHDDYSDDSSGGGDDDDFVQQHLRNQRTQLQKQDEGLEMLAQSAQRLGQMSMGIHEELDIQNQMLDDMEHDLGEATSNLDRVTKRTRELIRKSGGMKNFMIILTLIGIVVVLVFLLIYF
uniref:t-SNARE coiled-coil homology domain-containing protein n=1 Tax=Grammatophora oceanica TaxID=210454 RepID=A0A7S1VE05_9STRA|mmetsp:Transcript_44152/g.65478  ORF Transcript_44152/g.65478 Transcript_44152/m.65478 type:complete len:135 (+) Transcript_44152:100-504(+)|eukprot:CAMPEP_0194049556 /NCGR_PEP_ID=MMETSP0009_2-20130614/30752_1 /TAXON_ID=210454 /ORGANISM="Grammatophora oceanica, Strain CCMP 410" /LENGTH=134 /DNA_ID=CAMNT_0038695745 /DNA_START=97 /DNA_END=501 /DNA_ORIENTATION=-